MAGGVFVMQRVAHQAEGDGRFSGVRRVLVLILLHGDDGHGAGQDVLPGGVFLLRPEEIAPLFRKQRCGNGDLARAVGDAHQGFSDVDLRAGNGHAFVAPYGQGELRAAALGDADVLPSEAGIEHIRIVGIKIQVDLVSVLRQGVGGIGADFSVDPADPARVLAEAGFIDGGIRDKDALFTFEPGGAGVDQGMEDGITAVVIAHIAFLRQVVRLFADLDGPFRRQHRALPGDADGYAAALGGNGDQGIHGNFHAPGNGEFLALREIAGLAHMVGIAAIRQDVGAVRSTNTSAPWGREKVTTLGAAPRVTLMV